MVLVGLDKIYRAFPYFPHDIGGHKFSDRLHEARLAVASFWSLLGSPVVEPLSDRIGGHQCFGLASELAEKLVVEADGPVLAQKLGYVWDESVVIPFANFVQVLYGKAD